MQLQRSCCEVSTLDIELATLPTLSAQQLRVKWRDLRCGEPMAKASRDLMIREIAYKMQERAHGGLAPTIKRRLRTLAVEFERNGADALAPAPFASTSAASVRSRRLIAGASPPWARSCIL